MVRFVCRHRERSAGAGSDAGFSLVELVVALTILAVGIVGVIGVTNSSFRVAGGASAKSKMVAIATREIESLRAMKYDRIAENCGVISTTPVWSCYLDEQRVSHGLRYRMQRTISDAPDPNPLDTVPADRHKMVTVAVQWTDSTGAHEVYQRSYVYPGGIGVASGVTTTTVSGNCSPSAPSGLQVNQVMDYVGGVLSLQFTNSLDLRWSAGTSGCDPDAYVIKYKTLSGTVWNEVTRLATAREYRVTGLTAGTSYQFQVFAKSSNGNLSSGSTVVGGSTGTFVGSGCAVGTITVTPPGAKKKSNAESSDLEGVSPLVNMPINGTCTNYDIVYKKRVLGTESTRQMTLAGGIYTASVDPNGPWDVGTRYIDIVERTTRLKVGSVIFSVCEHNARTCG